MLNSAAAGRIYCGVRPMAARKGVFVMGRMNHDKSRSFFGGRGFYIALVLCLAAIGVAGYFVLVQQAKVAEEGKDKPVVRQEEVENVQRAQMPEAGPGARAGDPGAGGAAATGLLPAGRHHGDGVRMTELMYDETMADWRTHDGVDIRAEEGDAVKTAAAGTVKEVRYDDLMGVTVVISHADGYETQYSSLQQEPPVEQGKTVEAGDIIGLVGSTAAAEGRWWAHICFSVSKDGRVVDPQEYVK